MHGRLKELLTRIAERRDHEARWLNTVSLLEFTGARKISRTVADRHPGRGEARPASPPEVVPGSENSAWFEPIGAAGRGRARFRLESTCPERDAPGRAPRCGSSPC